MAMRFRGGPGIAVALAFALLPTSPANAQWTMSRDDSPIVSCDSSGGGYRHCRADTRNGVVLLRQYSGSPCILDRTWGYDHRGIWVDEGCRAEFALGSRGHRYDDFDRRGAYGPPRESQTLYCESTDGRHRRCNTSVRRGARLMRQASKAPCTEGHSWGWDRDGIWVRHGCRGDFKVD
jgi:hypothetical protein